MFIPGGPTSVSVGLSLFDELQFSCPWKFSTGHSNDINFNIDNW